jgi:hypothetical protein
VTWEADVARYAGFPLTADNKLVLDLWAGSENVAPQDNNPLAVNYPGYGGRSLGGHYAYPTEDAGARAMASFLLYPNYVGVMAAFRANAGLAALYEAINSSKWCSGCQNGQYPIQLHDYLSGGGFIAPSGAPSSNVPPPPPPAASTHTAWHNFQDFLSSGAPDLGNRLLNVKQSVDTLWQ